MVSKKLLQVLVKIGIAVLTCLGSYLGAAAQVHHWF